VRASVEDAVGAGDSFTAAMAIGLLKGWRLEDINHRANEVAAFVCSKAGATPALPETLREPFLGLNQEHAKEVETVQRN